MVVMSNNKLGLNGRIKRAPIDRLRSRLETDLETGCLQWTGPVDRKGYARIAVGGRRNRLAHRVAYEAEKGPIPLGLTLDHLCRNTRCCNPAHLEPVTGAENTRRKAHPTLFPCGHERSTENTSHRGRNRRCKECERASGRRARLAQREARNAAE